jgi:hypothetical protein
MPKFAEVGTGIVVLALFCTNVQGQSSADPLAPKAPSRPTRIEIGASFSTGSQGGLGSTSRWVLEKSGRCRGSVVTTSAISGQGTTTEYQLPGTIFEECRGLLERTDFFQMPSRQPEVGSEASSSTISATYDGKTHSVTVPSPATPPEGFSRLFDFVDSLPARGKVVPAQGTPQK